MIVTTKSSVRFRAEKPLGDSTDLIVRHTNRGEPYRDGIEFEIDVGDRFSASLFLEEHEARELRDLLNSLYPEKKK